MVALLSSVFLFLNFVYLFISALDLAEAADLQTTRNANANPSLCYSFVGDVWPATLEDWVGKSRGCRSEASQNRTSSEMAFE